jgi:hypothetical protein
LTVRVDGRAERKMASDVERAAIEEAAARKNVTYLVRASWGYQDEMRFDDLGEVGFALERVRTPGTACTAQRFSSRLRPAQPR